MFRGKAAYLALNYSLISRWSIFLIPEEGGSQTDVEGELIWAKLEVDLKTRICEQNEFQIYNF